jgi:heme-degrading monooxygenase HmoA
MTYLLGKASVEDFDAWKSAFERFDSFRTDHGQEGYQAFQGVDDPNEVVVLFEWADDEDPRAFFASEEMRERLAEAGVKGRPELTELEYIDQKPAQHPSA